MAWQDTLFEASFRGVTFEVLSETGERAKDESVKKSPYSNTSEIDDIGNGSLVYTMTAMLSGDNYEKDLEQLRIALDRNGSGELIHPVYGAVTVSVVKYSIKHTPELVDGCELDLTFRQGESSTDSAALFTENPSLTVNTTNPPPVLTIASPARQLENYQRQLDQLATDAATVQRRSIPEQVRSGVRTIRRTLETVTSGVDDLTSPPDWIGNIISDVDEVISAIPLNYDPMASWRSLITRIRNLGNVFADSDVPPLKSVGVSLVPALITQSVFSMVQTEQEQGMTLSPADLNTMRNEIRTEIQNTIDSMRSQTVQQTPLDLPPITDVRLQHIRDLKDAAANIQTLIQALIDQRPPLIVHTVKVTSSLRLVAHQLYGDHTRVAELKRLNKGLVNPAFIAAGTRINAYAQ